jgi:hypothetical protein
MLQEQTKSLQTLFNIFASVIRNGQLVAVKATNSDKVYGMSLEELKNEFRTDTRANPIVSSSLVVKDLEHFSTLGIDPSKILSMYIKDIGDIEINSIEFLPNNDIVLSDEVLPYKDELIYIAWYELK